MDKPLFVCSTESSQPEHPSYWERTPIIGKSENTTIGGTLVRDYVFRKFQYLLEWAIMSNTEFEDLQTLYNYHLANSTPITFTYPKWTTTANGITVLAELSSQKFVGGEGSTLYYESVSLILTEVSPR